VAAAAALALGVGAGMTGCTGETSFPLPTWDAGTPGTEQGAACSAWAATVCAWEDRCLNPLAQQWTGQQQCRTREQVYCELLASDPSVPFDASAVANCAYPEDSCTTPLPGFCLSSGKAPVGAPCTFGEGCASGFCSLDIQNDGCGVCARTESCDPPCAANEQCVGQVDGGLACIVPPAVGQPCVAPSYLCAAGGICQATGSGLMGICIATASAGQSCSNLGNGPVCADPNVETFCDETLHCRPFRTASYGQPCGLEGDGGDVYQCIGWGSCEYANPPICIPPAADGTLCDDQQGLRCLPPAQCIGARCVFPHTNECP
jgi:hypothetical protein